MKKREKEFEAFEEWEEEEEEQPGEEESAGFAEEGEEEEEEFEGGFAEEGEESDLPEGEEFAEALPEKPEPTSTAGAKKAPRTPPVAPSKFDTAALDLAPDVPVQVIAVMGKRGITMKELMELRMGQVIDLKRPPNETVDIVVSGKLFARGELVEIDGKLGVKILKLVK